MNQFLQRMQSIDRRLIYLVMAVTFLVTLIIGKPVTPLVMPPVQQLYDAIDAAPAGPDDGKLILIGMTFSASTIGESGNQARAIIRHLMLRKKRFAVISIAEPQGAVYAQLITTDIAKQYGYEYGKDWINFGYQVNTLALYKSMPRDIPGMLKVDGTENKPLTSFPIMEGIKTMKDIAMHVEITASDSVFNWVLYVQPMTSPRLKIGYACTGIMASEAYPYLDSGQLVGMAPGLKGAADYETLVDQLEEQQITDGARKESERFDPKLMQNVPAFPKPARYLMFTQNWAHIIVILFIIIGNVGMFLSRRKPRSAKETD